jgi:hypothetical protein
MESDWQCADRREMLIGGRPRELSGAKWRFRGENGVHWGEGSW